MAVGKDAGVLHYQALGPGVTRDDMAIFLTTLSTILDDESAIPSWATPPPIVTYRLRHPDIPFSSSHPMCSKFLNPIETCFSVLKASTEQRLAHIRAPCILTDYCFFGGWGLTEKAVSEIYKHVGIESTILFDGCAAQTMGNLHALNIMTHD